jgi:hypothetical protein
MKRRTFLIAGLGCVAVGLTGCGGDTEVLTATSVPTTPPFFRGAGGLIPPPGEAETFPLALDPDLLSVQFKVELPTTFSLPAGSVPEVIDQGELESCGAFACGYAVGSSVAAQTNGGSLSEKSFQNSPGYAYKKALVENGIARATDDGSGTYAKNYYNPLVAVGTASFAAVGYPSASLSLDQEGAAIDAIKLDPSLVAPTSQLGSWHYIQNYNNVDAIKRFLVTGRPVSFLWQIYKNYYDYKSGLFAGTELTDGYHFQAIVGYDDTQKAFRVQNSWGQDWGESGYCWMSYETYVAGVQEAHAVYAIKAQVPDGTGATLDATADDSAGGVPEMSIARVEQAQDGETVYLIFWHQFSEGLKLVSWEVTDPNGNRVTHLHGHYSRTGYYYLTRRDGRQFMAGEYTVAFVFENAAGRRFRATGKVRPTASLPGLQQGDLSDASVGAHNGKPVAHG